MRRGRRRRPGDRGSILVEAAFVLPICVFIMFGIIEYGMMFKDSLTATAAVRDGTRIGVTQARNPSYVTNVQAKVKETLLRALPGTQIQYLTIFKADPITGAPTGGGYESCSTDCSRFTFSAGNWVSAGGSGWAASSQKACGGPTTTDYLGVYVRIQHAYFTGLFGSARSLRSTSVLRLEPLPSAQGCM
jgi:hypothetical protein